MRTNVFTLMRCVVVATTMVLAAGMAGTLRAQDGPVAERVLDETSVTRFYTPASGALFALKTVYTYGQTLDVLVRSDDGGTSWREVSLPSAPVGELARRAVEVDPLNHTIVYASGREGLYKSDDDAATWRLIRPKQGNIEQIAVSPADDQVVYATLVLNAPSEGPPGIIRSRDGGASWETVLSGACAHLRVFPDPSKPARVVAALDCASERPVGLYLSEDQGATWTFWRPWPNGDDTRGGGVSGPLVAGGSFDRLYVAFSSHSTEAGLPLFVTPDAGQSWEDRGLSPREEVAPPSPKWQGGKFWSYVAALAADPQVPERIYVGLYGSATPLRTSADGGATWSPLTLPGNQRSVSAVGVGTDRQNLYVATRCMSTCNGTEGVYRLRLSSPE